jgi:hypothetical protein
MGRDTCIRSVFLFMNITKVAKLEETESFELEWQGEKVRFDAKKASLTPAFLKDVEVVIGYPKAVADTLTNWDVTIDDDGTKYPLTESELAKLPVDFLTAVLNKISDSWAGDKKKQKASASG